MDNSYPMRYIRGIDTDGYGNIYVLRDAIVVRYNVEGNFADKFEFLANMKLSDDISGERLNLQFPAGSYDNDIAAMRDPLAARSIAYGSGYGYIQGMSVKKYLSNSTSANATNTTQPFGDMLIVEGNDYVASSIQFMCPAGSA